MNFPSPYVPVSFAHCLFRQSTISHMSVSALVRERPSRFQAQNPDTPYMSTWVSPELKSGEPYYGQAFLSPVKLQELQAFIVMSRVFSSLLERILCFRRKFYILFLQ